MTPRLLCTLNVFRLRDLTDLLYYDALVSVDSFEAEIIRDTILRDSFAKKPNSDIQIEWVFEKPPEKEIKQNIEAKEKIAYKLYEAGLIIDEEDLFDEKGREQLGEWMHQEIESTHEKNSHLVKKNYEALSKFTNLITEERVRVFVEFAYKNDIHLVPRYSSPHGPFRVGKNEVLDILYLHLPRLYNVSYEEVDDIIAFLMDEETQVKRHRLFSWQNDLEMKIKNDEIKIEHLPDIIGERLDAYTEYLRHSELKFKIGISECLINLPRDIVLALTGIGIPKALKNLLEFKKRELELKEAELKAPGRELAYIVHAHRKFRD